MPINQNPNPTPAPQGYVPNEGDRIVIKSQTGDYTLTYKQFTELVGSGGGQGSIPVNIINQSGPVTIPDFTAEQKAKDIFEKIDIVNGDTITNTINLPSNFSITSYNGVTYDPTKQNIYREQWIKATGKSYYTIDKFTLPPIPDTTPPTFVSAATNTAGTLITVTVNEAVGAENISFSKFVSGSYVSYAGTKSIVGSTVQLTPTVTATPSDVIVVNGTISDLASPANTLTLATNQSVTNNVTAGGFTDNFNRANSNTALGNGWVAEGSSVWGIENNKAYCVSANNSGTPVNNFAYHEIGVSDFTFSVDLTSNQTSDSGVLLRYVNANNHFFLDVNFNAGNNAVILYKRVAGAVTQVGDMYSASGTSSVETHTYKVVCVGTSITVYIDNVQRITGTSSDHLTATKIGLSNYNGSGYASSADRFDNVIVTV